jgi:hypothetical protein
MKEKNEGSGKIKEKWKEGERGNQGERHERRTRKE